MGVSETSHCSPSPCNPYPPPPPWLINLPCTRETTETQVSRQGRGEGCPSLTVITPQPRRNIIFQDRT